MRAALRAGAGSGVSVVVAGCCVVAVVLAVRPGAGWCVGGWMLWRGPGPRANALPEAGTPCAVLGDAALGAERPLGFARRTAAWTERGRARGAPPTFACVMVVGPSRPLVVAVTRTMLIEVHGPVELAAPAKADARSSSVEGHQASVQLLLMRVVDALGPLEEHVPRLSPRGRREVRHLAEPVPALLGLDRELHDDEQHLFFLHWQEPMIGPREAPSSVERMG